MRVRNEQGFTLIELLIVVAIISIIAAIAVPGLLRARVTANESSAVVSLRTTTTAQISYSASCGKGNYASSYLVLGTPTVPGGDPFISPDLGSAATPVKHGYVFSLGPGAGSVAGVNDCLGTATITTWVATGVPQVYNTTGTRSFAVNRTNTIWELYGPAAPTEPFGAPAVPVQ